MEHTNDTILDDRPKLIANQSNKKSIGRRYAAGVIDYLIVLTLQAIFGIAFGDQTESGSFSVTGVKALVLPLIWLLYFPVQERITGNTLAKRIFHLRVVRLDGRPIGILELFGRRILDFIDTMFLGIPGVVTVLSSSKNQRIGDMMAGTTVVRTDATCRFCHEGVELDPREIIRESFTCPNCNQLNN